MSSNNAGEPLRQAFNKEKQGQEQEQEQEQAAFKAAGDDKTNAMPVLPVMVEPPQERLPPYIKVDCSIDEEISVPGCGCLLIMAGIFLVSAAGGSAVEYIAYFMIVIGAAAVISLKFIDNFYIINTAERKIYYRRKVFNKTSITPFLESDDIHAVTVSCSFYKNKGSRWWEYKVALIKKDGLIVDFGYAKKEESAAEFNKTARGIASALQCGYIECPDKHALSAIKEINGGVRVYFTKKE